MVNLTLLQLLNFEFLIGSSQKFWNLKVFKLILGFRHNFIIFDFSFFFFILRKVFFLLTEILLKRGEVFFLGSNLMLNGFIKMGLYRIFKFPYDIFFKGGSISNFKEVKKKLYAFKFFWRPPSLFLLYESVNSSLVNFESLFSKIPLVTLIDSNINNFLGSYLLLGNTKSLLNFYFFFQLTLSIIFLVKKRIKVSFLPKIIKKIFKVKKKKVYKNFFYLVKIAQFNYFYFKLLKHNYFIKRLAIVKNNRVKFFSLFYKNKISLKKIKECIKIIQNKGSNLYSTLFFSKFRSVNLVINQIKNRTKKIQKKLFSNLFNFNFFFGFSFFFHNDILEKSISHIALRFKILTLHLAIFHFTFFRYTLNFFEFFFFRNILFKWVRDGKITHYYVDEDDDFIINTDLGESYEDEEYDDSEFTKYTEYHRIRIKKAFKKYKKEKLRKIKAGVVNHRFLLKFLIFLRKRNYKVVFFYKNFFLNTIDKISFKHLKFKDKAQILRRKNKIKKSKTLKKKEKKKIKIIKLGKKKRVLVKISKKNKRKEIVKKKKNKNINFLKIFYYKVLKKKKNISFFFFFKFFKRFIVKYFLKSKIKY